MSLVGFGSFAFVLPLNQNGIASQRLTKIRSPPSSPAARHIASYVLWLKCLLDVSATKRMSLSSLLPSIVGLLSVLQVLRFTVGFAVLLKYPWQIH
jgi:hypothetical protein